MKGTTDSTAINKTLAALDSYVLLGKSGLRVSPLALGTMVNIVVIIHGLSLACLVVPQYSLALVPRTFSFVFSSSTRLLASNG